MISRVGIVGVGHLAGCIVNGLRRAECEIEVILSPRNTRKSSELAAHPGVEVAPDNQSVVDSADLVFVMTRPVDLVPTCRDLVFHEGQEVVSTAAGVDLDSLCDVVNPAMSARSMPISSAELGRSATLLYPDLPHARAFFEMLGTVHVPQNEEQITVASTIPAFYGWIYALLDSTIDWTVARGLPPKQARDLVLETARAASEMGLAHPEIGLSVLLDSLATPGGITRRGLETLKQSGGLTAWTEALDAVYARLNRDG